MFDNDVFTTKNLELNKELMDLALKARENSYSPYSNFAVGAALLAKNGKVYLGCNIENSSYTPTICAERVAFFKAVSEGVKEFEAIAIVGGKTKEEGRFCAPCGVCRQVMNDFRSDKGIDIILEDDNGEPEVHTIDELLPLGFDL